MLEQLTAAHENVGADERLASAVAGGALVLAALWKRGPWSFALAAGGAVLTYRAMSGFCPLYGALGVNHAGGTSTKEALGGSRGVHLFEEIEINRPVADVYRFWRDFTNLPRFMTNVERVTLSDEGRRSHWVVRAPMGTTVEWDARIINEVENDVIGWQSDEGAQVPNAGSVHFSPAADGRGTRVRVKLQYLPPGGKVAASIASFVGDDPSAQVREDLARLKQVLES